MSDQQQQQQHQQANRGILPSETLNALDYLVDRLNAASGHLPSTALISSTTTNNPSSTDNNDNTSTNENNPSRSLPIRALLVGTNEGVGLSRSLGSAHTATQLQNPNDPNFSHSGSMSEEVLSSIETVWATIVSAVPPHVMAASAAGAAAATAAAAAEASSSSSSNGNNNKSNEEKKAEEKEDTVPPHIQPAHPLLSPLGMGDHIRTVTATYDNCTLMHIHMAPLVVTFVTLPEANLGAIRSALPSLKILLEPVRRALVRSRGGGVNAPPIGASSNGGNGGMTLEQQQQAALVQQQALQQQQAMAQALLMQQQQSQMQGHQMDPALYQQQMQQLMAQQQQQQFRQ